ncbi:MAG: sodium:calcium antiporter [Dehalococcoidia bacterium]|nr:sodium:calcium antiporter [Dehalococcoidia bacterium]
MSHNPQAIPASTSAKSSRKGWILLFLAITLTLPGLYLRLAETLENPLPPATASALLLGLTMVGAAFLLAWASDVAQLDVSRSFAFAVLAVVAVLPEYAVDASFAYRAASDPIQGEYAIANMTGANRLLIGIAWPLILGLFWLATNRRKSGFEMARTNTMELGFLAMASLFVIVIVVKGMIFHSPGFFGRIDLIDAGTLVSIYVVYLLASARQPQEEPHLFGPAAAIASLGKSKRRIGVVALFLFSGTVILLSADPFAQNLVKTGEAFNIPPFVLVQWLAPIASEAPEVVVASIFALRNAPLIALTLLISSEVNQFTLLIGTLPVVYSVGLGRPGALPFGELQVTEIFLTAAQSIFAIVLLSNLKFSHRGAWALFILFAAQLSLSEVKHSHQVFGAAYIVLAAILLLTNIDRLKGSFMLLPATLKEFLSPKVMVITGALIGTGVLLTLLY